ncbi:MAG: 2-amino-4-hydroxy-6-hydroxymethyldihydropteridine diphosphokinase [Puniceicoccales bacterium]|jgi:2-amino-4-hydroxy-6-hydroxymethyldihydropteridine diphosphokinase/dihydroneopterin aldolase|nr:2-amino-4-hydroxy-6-hydroxymethyldihydropteridine diphosphokinase [Puniceicoccales bacterium]
MDACNDCGDEIQIRGLRCQAHCGVGAEERKQSQDLRIDAALELVRSGDFLRRTIADTVDYTVVADMIFKILNESEFHLIENIAQLVCMEILAKFSQIWRVTVTVRKKPTHWINFVENFTAKTSLRRFTGAIGLGTNLGENLQKNLGDARTEIEKIPHTRIIQISSIHRTAPLLLWNQPDFLNQCLLIETWLHPEEFLRHTQKIERAMGRIKSFPNHPRVMDIDLLLFDNFIVKNLHLTLPHPSLEERRFLIEELSEFGIKIWPKDEGVMKQKCEPLSVDEAQLKI